jgi:hypothetical protein
MDNLAKLLLVGLSILPLACAARAPPDGEIDFNAVESQAFFLSDDQMQRQAQDYLDAHFPKGYPVASAMAALTKAGAKCYYQTDPSDPTAYFCDYGRPGHGLAYFYEQIDWGIAIYFSSDKKTVKYITVTRYGSSL